MMHAQRNRLPAIFSLALILGTALTAAAQSRPDYDTTRRQVATFDRFLDSHPRIAAQLQQHPGLADNPNYVAAHPALRQFLSHHPGVREEVRENPRAFMRREARYERYERRRYHEPGI